LKTLGFFPQGVNPTTFFGRTTAHSVTLFQNAHLLAKDGTLDDETRDLLNKVANNLYGSTSTTPPVGTNPTSTPPTGGNPTSTTPVTPSSTGTGTGGYVFTRNMGPGSSGPDVTALQQLLIRLGDYPAAIVSGYYGSLTEKAVETFQANQGIISYGSPFTTGYGAVGPHTRAALNAEE
jgi:peptidoglycan hydrolase-like protein with peptidoglycan-binding domain